jgi:hypothetical protein
VASMTTLFVILVIWSTSTLCSDLCAPTPPGIINTMRARIAHWGDWAWMVGAPVFVAGVWFVARKAPSRDRAGARSSPEREGAGAPKSPR